eukprot:Sdes_comp15000_c0_seq1m3749
MSKSKHNGVDPRDVMDQYGADALRFYLLFKAPVSLSFEWKHEGVFSSRKWLEKFWNHVWDFFLQRENHFEASADWDPIDSEWEIFIVGETNKAIQRYSENCHVEESYKMNVSIAALMELFNSLKRVPIEKRMTKSYETSLKSLLILLSPICPHFSAELWRHFGGAENSPQDSCQIFDEKFPQMMEISAASCRIFDSQKDRKIHVALNGKTKGWVEISGNFEREQDLIDFVLNSEKTKEILNGAPVVKTFLAKNSKFINLVV